jgi:DNA repair protein RadD
MIAPQLELRPRQTSSVHRLFEAMRQGFKRILLVMPTGAGKRYIAVHLCKVALENDRRVLFVTNRRLLVSQMFSEAAKFGVDHGVIMAGEQSGNFHSPIQIASLQTLQSRCIYDSLGIATGHGLPPADLIIIDEAHQDIEGYMQLLALYDAKVVALTATPVGPEGVTLVPPYQTIIEGCLNSELIADGLLLKTMVYAPSEPSIEGVRIVKKQEYNQAQLGRAVSECTVFADVFNEWAPFADRKTVCFVPGVAYGNDLVRQFNARLGPGQFCMISAKTKQNEREQIFDDVRSGRAKGLVSVDVLKEGWDMPEISCGIDLQPNTQLRTYWQKIGRIKRSHEGQSHAVWLDFAGNYWRFPHPDNDPEWPTGNETTQEAIKRNREDGKEAQPIMCPKCSFVRQYGSTCPQCGHKSGEPMRRIRMGNGKLKNVPAKAKEKREKSEDQRRLEKWKGLLFAGMKKDWSFSQAAMLYHKTTGEWPKKGWPGTFDQGSLAWKRSVKSNLTPKELMIQVSDIIRGGKR